MSQFQSSSDTCIYFHDGRHDSLDLVSVKQVSKFMAYPHIHGKSGDVIYCASTYYIRCLDGRWKVIAKPRKELLATVLLLKD